MIPDNPAYRLLQLFKNGKDIPKNIQCLNAWMQLLDVPNEDEGILLSRLAKVMALPSEVGKEVQLSYPGQKIDNAHFQKQLRLAFTESPLNTQWGTFINRIDQHIINHLQMASAMLDSKSNTKCLNEDELSKIENKVNQMFDMILKSEIDEDIKKYLSHCFNEILFSIKEYKISGSQAIMNTIEKACGHALVDVEYKNFLKTNAVGEEFVKGLGVVANMVAISVGGKSIIEGFYKLLG